MVLRSLNQTSPSGSIFKGYSSLQSIPLVALELEAVAEGKAELDAVVRGGAETDAAADAEVTAGIGRGAPVGFGGEHELPMYCAG